MTEQFNVVDLADQTNLTPLVLKVLKYVGNLYTKELVEEDDPEKGFNYPLVDNTNTVAILDDGWGVIVGMYVEDGHVLFVVDFGEDYFIFSFTSMKHNWVGDERNVALIQTFDKL